MQAEFDELYEFVKISSASFDESHDVSHAVAVYNNTIKIAETYKNTMEMDILMYASMLHDVCDHKYPNSIKEEELMKFIVGKLGKKNAIRVMNIINNISFSKQVKDLRKKPIYPDCMYLDIVSDADRLEAIGQIGIDRCITYTTASGGIVPDDVINHCHEKLLRLKDEYIVTFKGKELAEPLHQVILDYVDSQTNV